MFPKMMMLTTNMATADTNGILQKAKTLKFFDKFLHSRSNNQWNLCHNVREPDFCVEGSCGEFTVPVSDRSAFLEKPGFAS